MANKPPYEIAIVKSLKKRFPRLASLRMSIVLNSKHELKDVLSTSNITNWSVSLYHNVSTLLCEWPFHLQYLPTTVLIRSTPV